MSYWVYLEDEHGPVSVDRFQEGGTFDLMGETTAILDVTYNYSEVFRMFEFSLRDLHGMKAGDTAARLEFLAGKLPNRPYKTDYWAPTPGNAGAVVHRLLGWAKQYPDARWRVS